ncbi:HAMP domain-containing protein [Skermania sp. ID1734]|nr:HAMP domain-containing protein [Skermania sp. ID1734]
MELVAAVIRPAVLKERVVDSALQSRFGFTVAGELCGFGGFAVVIIQLWLTGIIGRLGTATTAIVIATLGYLMISSSVGAYATNRMWRKYLDWYLDARQPSPREARRVIGLPRDMGMLNVALWLPGIALDGVLVAILVGNRDLVTSVLLVTFGAVTSSGFAYLVFDQLMRPLIPLCAAVIGPAEHPSTSALARVGITWLLASGIPWASLALILTDPATPLQDRVRGGLVVMIVAVACGILATGALARAVAIPLRNLRAALNRVAGGDLNVHVPIDSTSEIGQLQGAINDMTEGLRERERLRRVFDRHVGVNVAERALRDEVDLAGDLREVTALFVDIVGSTELAHQLEPHVFVDKLNRLLTVVVEATDANQGLVNKFEGDAALCIFGAPIELDDDASAALRTARRIRNAVVADDELDIGIGVARGTVFAGDIGSDKRLEYTVIGDPVNEAARLTEAAKKVPQRILVTQAVVEAASSAERDLWTPHGVLRLRGRAEETKSWTDNSGYPPGRRARRSRNTSGSETGLSQTNPRQTYAAAAPSQVDRSASSGAPSAGPATTTAPPGTNSLATSDNSPPPDSATTAT